MKSGKKIFFISDLHLGIDAQLNSESREILAYKWLNEIENEAAAIYLLGDVFDYWFEYSEVIPKGFELILGKLKDLRLKKIPIYFFTGNHDMWIFKYFEDYFDIPTYRNEIIKEIEGKIFYLAHGDATGKVQLKDTFIKNIFANHFLQWCFARIHPNSGLKIMKYFSRLSRNSHDEYEQVFTPEREILLNFAEKHSSENPDIDYYVFGHRHIPKQLKLANGHSEFINLGDWVSHFTYGVFDGEKFEIKTYKL